MKNLIVKNAWFLKGSYYLLVEAENEGSKDENKTFSLLNNKYPVGYKDFVVCSNNHEFKHLQYQKCFTFHGVASIYLRNVGFGSGDMIWFETTFYGKRL